MALILLAASIAEAFRHQSDRIAARAAVLAADEQPTDLYFLGRGDEWQGKQYAVNWIEPAGTERTVLPPGMPELPEPGVAVVSPALASLIEREPAMAVRYPRYEELGAEGLADGGELIAWVRPAAGETIAGASSTFRIGAFGTDDKSEWIDYSIISTPDDLMLRVGLAGFLLVPGALVLFLGLTSASRLRAERLAVLSALGAPRPWTLGFILAEATLLLLPPIVLVTVLWGVVVPRLDVLPIIGKHVLPGDLGIPPLGLLLAVVLVWLVAAMLILATAVVPAWRHRGQSTPRPESAGRKGSLLRAVPLLAALGVVGFGAVLGALGQGYRGANVFIYGFAGVVVATPLAMPALLGPVGRWLARLEPVPALLAGRRLAWDPVRTGRPFAMLAALIVIASMVMGFLLNVRDTASPFGAQTSPSAALLTWFTRDSGAADRLREQLSDMAVVPYADDGKSVRLAASCSELANAFAWEDGICSPSEPYRLTSVAERHLPELFQGRDLVLDPEVPAIRDGRASLAALSGKPSNVLVDALGAAFPLAAYPGLSILSVESFMLREPALVRWTDYGLMAAIIVTGLACVLSLIDRVIGTQKDRRYLTNVGLTAGRLRTVELWAFLIPYAVIVTAALLIGVVSVQASLWIQGDRMPVSGLVAMAGFLILAGAVAACAVALLGSFSPTAAEPWAGGQQGSGRERP